MIEPNDKGIHRRVKRWRTAVMRCIFLTIGLSVLSTTQAFAEEEIALKVGETRLMSVKPVSRVAVGNAGIVDVKVVSPTELLLVAKGEGKTAVLLWPHDGPPSERQVRVLRPDPTLSLADLKGMIGDDGISVRVAGGYLVLEGEPRKVSTRKRLAKISAAFGGQILDLVAPEASQVSQSASSLTGDSEPGVRDFPEVDEVAAFLKRTVGEGLWAELQQDRLVVGGQVGDELQMMRVREVASLFDPKALVLVSVSSAPPRQVSVKARVVEIQRSALRELGVEWPAEVLVAKASKPIFGLSDYASEDVIARLRAFEQSGKARMLAEPNLMVADGSEGSFLVGGQVPVPIQQQSGTTVEWKEYGVRLKVIPSIKSDDVIRLAIRPEVSTLDWTNATKVDGTVLPALRVRSTETVVLHKNGGTVVVAGLLHSLEGDYTTHTPWLAQLPLLGRLFRLPRTSSEDTELAVFVSTTIVAAGEISDAARLEWPDPAENLVSRRKPE